MVQSFPDEMPLAGRQVTGGKNLPNISAAFYIHAFTHRTMFLYLSIIYLSVSIAMSGTFYKLRITPKTLMPVVELFLSHQ